jgi:hypothetical protein
MDDTLYLLFFPFVFLVGSMYALYASVIERKVKLSGLSTEARVIKVERAIPSGLSSIFHNKKGSFECDYLLRLSYMNLAGKQRQISTSVAARMKVVEGMRFPFFSEGDTLLIRYSEKHPRTVVILQETIKQRQGNIFPIVLWAFCSGLIVAIIVTTLIFL